MRDPEKAQRLMKERIVKLDSGIEIARKRAEEERMIAVEAKKNEAIERRKAEHERRKADDEMKMRLMAEQNEVIERRRAEDEMKMRLVAEAKAEGLQKEPAKMRAKVNAMSALE